MGSPQAEWALRLLPAAFTVGVGRVKYTVRSVREFGQRGLDELIGFSSSTGLIEYSLYWCIMRPQKCMKVTEHPSWEFSLYLPIRTFANCDHSL